jgi:hypothetical protein
MSNNSYNINSNIRSHLPRRSIVERSEGPEGAAPHLAREDECAIRYVLLFLSLFTYFTIISLRTELNERLSFPALSRTKYTPLPNC